VSGTATVTRRAGPEPEQTVTEVRYDQFSDDGEWVIDGTESTTHDNGLLGAATYTADLVLSGIHDGFLRADATISAGGIDGAIESNVDGRALHLP
jgi:broad specificity polyphosphatase/5'/3'-nucleotidase SurE